MSTPAVSTVSSQLGVTFFPSCLHIFYHFTSPGFPFIWRLNLMHCYRFMPPDDPLGRSGPTLDNFLRIQPRRGDPPPPCPYGKKCTYGNKCKFHHPERGPLPHKSVTERLVEHAQRHREALIQSRDSSPGSTQHICLLVLTTSHRAPRGACPEAP